MIALLFSGTWSDPKIDNDVNAFFSTVGDSIRKEALAMNQAYDFVYLNDASGNEKPFSVYGGGFSLNKLKKIARKYGMFASGTSIPERPFLTSHRSPRGISDSSSGWIQIGLTNPIK